MKLFTASLMVLLLILVACKNEPVERQIPPEHAAFFSAYSPLTLPFQVTDTTINSVPDSGIISLKAFTNLVSDSIFNVPFGKNRNLKLLPIGKIERNARENYFVTKASSNNQSAIYLTVFDSNKVMANMPLLVADNDKITNSASIDKKLSIVVNKDWYEGNDQYYDRTIYAYNNAGLFSVVLTETNQQRTIDGAVINPLDTFPSTFAYSGDYPKNKNNLISIRDGRQPNQYLFFIHFENSGEEPCIGEIKGEMTMTSEKTGEYRGSSDLCVLQFNFSGSQVTIKENGSCGNYRGIRCFFNHTFNKKRTPKTSAKKK